MTHFSHTETKFEAEAEDILVASSGYQKGYSEAFNRETALDEATLLEFVQNTQPKEWEKMEKIHGAAAKKQFFGRFKKEVSLRGLLDVIRNGIKTHGTSFKLAYFQPVTNLNPETQALFNKNILKVTRQLKYDADKENSIDLVLTLNGIVVVTIELKNAFTGQTVQNAKKQYIFDRDPKTPLFLFNRGSLVHFAVDADEVFMTTHIKGRSTFYLPFNKGWRNGAGNPPNPDGRRTDYLWYDIFHKDSLLDIIGKFIHLQVEEVEVEGKKAKKEKLIFPRFHQLQVVRRLIGDAKENGAGKNYLIQHSAGSGKSNSIAWLSYRLASLHDDQNERVFDSIIVVTDRTVLDSQLQDTIYQFEHKQGVVQRIDKDSGQLAKALEAGTSIIITTLQKFPFVLAKIGELPSRKYAIIQDEAHSSTGGEIYKKMKEVLMAKSLEEAAEEEEGDDYDAEDAIRDSMVARGKHYNLSFFGFTATPKFKTLEVFGEKDEQGRPKPFDLYSMKQAIEEGFIHDVLKNYTTYKTYFRLSKAIEDDPNIDKKKASSAIARFVSLHPHNLAQKTEVIIEYFRSVVAKKIGGLAKALVVTGSRLHAVRYKQEFDRYIKEKGYTDLKTLVAFSGKVIDQYGNEFVETEMNKGIKEKELPEKFDTNEYQVLIVAEKYQTGFDQPLLHTMYVDRRISGVKAVQTLSRLNRTHPGKEDTFVLDFANEEEDIINSFQPYYEMTTVQESTDPDHLYDLKHKIDTAQVIRESELEGFSKYYFTKKTALTEKDHGRLNAFIDPAVDRYKHLNSEEMQDDFKHALTSFIRLYAFLTQIMPFHDADLEKMYGYGRFLLKKLPKKSAGGTLNLQDELALEYYRLQKVQDNASFVLEDQPEYEIKGITTAGMRNTEEEAAALSEIINVLNERFGTEFQEADRLFLDQVEEDLVANESLSKQANNNTLQNFEYGFDDVFVNALISRMSQNQEIFAKIMDDKDFSSVIKEWMIKKVYQRLRK